MGIRTERPRIEPKFQAEIYRSMQDGRESYRVVLGREGSVVPPKLGAFKGYHEVSDFMPIREIEAWVNTQVNSLEEAGNHVEFDESPSYKISRMLESMAEDEEPIRRTRRVGYVLLSLSMN